MCNRGMDDRDRKRLKWLNPEDTDTIVNLSGGFECLAALWYAKEKGYKPVCLALYNPNAKGKLQMELKAAKITGKIFLKSR